MRKINSNAYIIMHFTSVKIAVSRQFLNHKNFVFLVTFTLHVIFKRNYYDSEAMLIHFIKCGTKYAVPSC